MGKVQMNVNFHFLFLFSVIINIVASGCQSKPAPDYASQYGECLQAFSQFDPFDQRDSLNICLRGAKMPDFSIQDINGKMLNASDLKGQVTVINFWSTTCRPCLAEMPGLNEIVARYKNKPIRFLALTADKKERLEKVFLGKRDFDFELFSDAHPTISRTFHYEWGLPLTLVFDKNGLFVCWVSGSYDDFRAADAIKEELIPVLDELLE